MLKFTKSLINSLLTERGLTSTDLQAVKDKAHLASIIFTEEILTKDEIGLTKYSVTKITDVLRVCNNALLSQTIDKNNVDMAILTEHVNNKKLNDDDAENVNNTTDAEHVPLNPYESATTQNATENKNFNNTNDNVNFNLSTLMPSNLLDASATNITTITSNQGNDANERFLHNINELKE